MGDEQTNPMLSLSPQTKAHVLAFESALGAEPATLAEILKRLSEEGPDRQELISQVRSQLMLTGVDADRIAELVSALEAVVDEPAAEDATVMRLLAQVEELEQERVELSTGLVSTKGSVDETQQQLRELEEKTAHFTEERSSLEAKAAQVGSERDAAFRDAEELRGQLESAREELEAAKSQAGELASTTGRLTETQARLQAAEEQIASLSEEKEKLGAAASETEAARARAEELERAAEEARASAREAEALSERMNEQNIGMLGEIESKDAEIAQLKEKLAAVETEVEGSKRAAEAASKERDEAKANLAEKGGTIETLRAEAQQAAGANERLGKLTAELKEREGQIASLKREAEEAGGAAAEAERLRAELEEATSQLSLKEELVGQFRSEGEKSAALVKEADAMKKKLASLESERDEARKGADENVKALDAAGSRIKELEAALKKTEKSSQKAADGKTKELDAARSRVTELEAALKKAKQRTRVETDTKAKDLDAAKARAAEVEKKLKDSEDKARAEVEKKAKELGAAEARVTEFEKLLKEAEERSGAQLEKKTKDLGAAEARLAEMERQLGEAGSKTDERAKQLAAEKAAVEQEVDRLGAELDSVRAEKDALQKERDEVAKEIFDKNRLIENLQSQLERVERRPTSSVAATGKIRPKARRTMRFDEGAPPAAAAEPSAPAPVISRGGGLEPPPPGAAKERAVTAAVPLKPGTKAVIVAGTEAKAQKSYDRNLEGAGFAPLRPADAIEAWKHIESGAAVALVMDVRFDGEGGREILKRLSVSKRTFPTVVLCDYDYPVNELPSLGRAKVLTKPIPPDQVIMALETVTRKK